MSPSEPKNTAAEDQSATASEQTDDSTGVRQPDITISLVRSKYDASPRRERVTWDELIAMLATPRRTACTLDTCGTGVHADLDRDGKPRGCRHKDAGGWVPATFSVGRKKATVQHVSMLVVDADHLPDDATLETVLAKLERYRYVAHATHSDRPGDRCARIALPLSRPVPGGDWERFWPAAMAMLGMPADPSCCDAGRLYYLPSRPSDADYWHVVHDGEPIDVAAVVRSAPRDAPSVAASLDVDPAGVVVPGQRHAMLKSLAGAMRHRGAGLTEIEAALLAANANRCRPAKGEAEVKDIAAWAAAQPVTSLARDGMSVIDAPRESPATGQPRWKIEPATPEWITVALPPREHLLVDTRTGRGAMDQTGVWLIGGAGGAGKSYALLGLALALVSGGPWLRTFRPARPGRVLVVAAEDCTDDIRRRVHAIAAAEDVPPDAVTRLEILSLHDRVTSLVAQLGDVYAASADTTSLCAELASREPYDLVIVDPYGRIAGVSVDADNAAAAATISALDMIATAARGLVLGVAHTSARARLAAAQGRAEGATAIRGATGQIDYARGVLRLERDDDAIWLSLAKANHVPPWEPVALKRGDHGELVPLGLVELGAIQDARSADTKAARRAAELAERNRLDDEAAEAAIAANPMGSVRALRAVVESARGCGKDRAESAILRVRK